MIQNIKLKDLAPNDGQIEGLPKNPRFIKDSKFEKLKKSLQDDPEMLNLRELLVFQHGKKYVIIGGNMRYRAALELGIKELPCKIIPPETPVEKLKSYTIKDNSGYGEWSWDDLANEWDSGDLDDWGVDVWQDNADSDGNADSGNKSKNASLSDRFVIPPFSVLDTRKWYWQERKKAWRELIGDMGESRNNTLIKAPEMRYKKIYEQTHEHRKSLGIGFPEYLEKYVSAEVKEQADLTVLSRGVSILDPVLAEIVCRWFGVEGGKSFDCFAGDTVFGYVAAHLGHEFTGIELRSEQAELNNKRTEGLPARYICDDGQNVAKHIKPDTQDLLFSCPPYFDLEKYSDDASDASNQSTYADFIAILENAFTNAVSCLKNDRFAVVVVGDVRDRKTGFYHSLTSDVKRIFKESNMSLYNELILVETGASTALRAARCMNNRKIVKMHQNVLVFYKGNSKNIKKRFKTIKYASEDLELFAVDNGDKSGNN
ncbi:MAG: ParB N-terminal domain-containing protein [Clostridiales bacterium]|nr:ParB N-terminal domain-containing protein [Clostridiales bacterium]